MLLSVWEKIISNHSLFSSNYLLFLQEDTGQVHNQQQSKLKMKSNIKNLMLIQTLLPFSSEMSPQTSIMQGKRKIGTVMLQGWLWCRKMALILLRVSRINCSIINFWNVILHKCVGYTELLYTCNRIAFSYSFCYILFLGFCFQLQLHLHKCVMNVT